MMKATKVCEGYISQESHLLPLGLKSQPNSHILFRSPCLSTGYASRGQKHSPELEDFHLPIAHIRESWLQSASKQTLPL